jgi:hypothetical protein
MANYIKATNFAVKDSLTTGDPNKVVKGTELDSEFNAIASAVTSKANSDSPTLTGTPTAPTAAAGTNSTQVASTAFVIGERTTTATLTNKTLTSPTVSGLSLTDGSIVLEGSTANDFETTLTVTDPTADRTITFPDKTGTVALTSDIANTALYTTSGTYTIAGTTMTISATAHGRSVGDVVYLNFTSGTAVDNYFTVVTAATNSFTITYGSSITTSGNFTGYYSNKGLISIASPAEALKGTNTDRAVTPAGLAGSFTKSLASNGWQKLQSGLIMQWGTSSSAGQDTSVTVTYPIAFTTAVYNVQITGRYDLGITGAGIQTVSNMTTTNFVINNGQDYGMIFYWFAIGY